MMVLCLGNLKLMSYKGKYLKRLGILSKPRYYACTDILVAVYYALIQSFLMYDIEVWGLTCPSHLNPIYILQKKATGIIAFS